MLRLASDISMDGCLRVFRRGNPPPFKLSQKGSFVETCLSSERALQVGLSMRYSLDDVYQKRSRFETLVRTTSILRRSSPGIALRGAQATPHPQQAVDAGRGDGLSISRSLGEDLES